MRNSRFGGRDEFGYLDVIDISDGCSPLLSCWSEICLDFSNYEAKISHLIVPCIFLLFMFRIYCMMAWRIHGSSFPVVPTGNLEN